jgi:NAD-dependent deacetylase
VSSHQPDPALVGYLRTATRILVFTGAGVSTASGIPDFRGPDGIWKQRRPVLYEEFLASEASRIEYWEYKLDTWAAHSRARPNAVHHAIAQLELAGKVVAVVTQNIDGLHRRAGTSPQRLVELHGTDHLVRCLQCEATSDPAAHLELFKATRRPPRCPCGGLLKAATISFGQQLRTIDLERAAAAAATADLVLALGSTLSVYPAASIPLLAADRGASYIIVNQGVTEHDSHPRVTLRLEGDVTAIVPPAVDAAITGLESQV